MEIKTFSLMKNNSSQNQSTGTTGEKKATLLQDAIPQNLFVFIPFDVCTMQRHQHKIYAAFSVISNPLPLQYEAYISTAVE